MQARPSIFKCKNCGAEGKHKTFEYPVLICLTCGARDEHSMRRGPHQQTVSQSLFSLTQFGLTRRLRPMWFQRSQDERMPDCVADIPVCY
ncbi:hypothetical protein EDD15DRAFT_1691511 [Pisolithus albus]|nr:hypothetical protein EDD15DRAFT_1691511 [Pisolithus albus]